MSPDEVFERVGNVPYMRLSQGRMFHDFITSNRLRTGLELGFLHGVSTAYIAAALDEVDGSCLTAIGSTTARDRVPNIEHILGLAGLSRLVKIYYEPTSFNWRLMRLLEEDRFESFDFCYINVAHSWYDAGLAFSLAERLVNPGGWVVFNDLSYTFRESRQRNEPRIKRMPEDEKSLPQVERVFTLLAESNPYFGSYRRLGRFGFAQKRAAIWSQPERGQHAVEIAISKAADRARCDPEFREGLLLSPGDVISSLTGKPAEEFKNLRFVETDSLAPQSSTTAVSGEVTIYLERPAWVRTIGEAELQRMLDD
ncbi:MAG TPA: class I SAM-dependent methyltransferase [Candidatus Solibacter sp.]|nr:class I SAM-dependent methyltransferase [Candidatus Solibacter sp.]